MSFWTYGLDALKWTNPVFSGISGLWNYSQQTYDTYKADDTASSVYKDVKGLVTGAQETFTTASKTVTILAVIAAIIYFSEKKKGGLF